MRWRWIAAFVALLLVIAVGVWLRSRWRVQPLVLSPVADLLPADGRERAVLRVVRRDSGRVDAGEMTAEFAGNSGRDGRDLRLRQAGAGAEVWMEAPVVASEREVRVRSGGKMAVGKVQFVVDEADSFGDGMPDALRLHSAGDRAAFRQWFWRLAELQAELPDGKNAAEIQDCSALLRYAYREALSAHNAEWAATKHMGDVAFGSVGQWRYPETMLGMGLFRVRPGPFVAGDEGNGAFAQFADAHALMAWNTYGVGRDVRAAKPGDLIFYRQLEQNSPYHSMVITGSDAGWVVYHTGPIGKQKGEIRRMKLTDLLEHPDGRWRPVTENPNFLGVFRWNVLREGD